MAPALGLARGSWFGDDFGWEPPLGTLGFRKSAQRWLKPPVGTLNSHKKTERWLLLQALRERGFWADLGWEPVLGT